MIENHRENFKALMSKRYRENVPTRIDALSYREVLSAFFDGYEVEEKFKNEDWVTNGEWVGKIIEEYDSSFEIDIASLKSKELFELGEIRHATSEEIEQEERRRMFEEARDKTKKGKYYVIEIKNTKSNVEHRAVAYKMHGSMIAIGTPYKSSLITSYKKLHSIKVISEIEELSQPLF